MNTEGLKAWLFNNKRHFVNLRQGEDGCSTCGYGAEEITELDFPKLLAEIDKFAASFKSKS